MHESVNKDEFQFYVTIHEHADVILHSEQEVRVMPSFNMHYENEDIDFVLPSDLLYDDNMTGETDRRSDFSLPHESLNEN